MPASPKAVLVALALALAGCAGPADVTWCSRCDGSAATAADQARFQQDRAACEWELAKMNEARQAGRPTYAGLSGPSALADAISRQGDGEGLMLACMGARGWTARRG